jgi:hypothetical protein
VNPVEELPELLSILELIPSGRITVNVGDCHFLRIDSDAKTVEIDTDGARVAGLRLSALLRMREGSGNFLQGSEHILGLLASLGWNVTIFVAGDKVLTMGSGVSRLTGYVSVNPLRLRKLISALG